MEALVEFDYQAQEQDELSIQKGDILTNVVKMDGGWWEGELKGKRGVFPDNFVKELKKDDLKSRSQAPAAPAANKRGGHVAELANQIGKKALNMGPGQQGHMIKRPGDTGHRRRAKATFSYTPENEDELMLEVGDIVDVLKQEEEGWWEGTKGGKVGMFPSNFVELLDEDAERAEENMSGEYISIQGKKVMGVGLGNIFNDGPIKLRPTQNSGPPGRKPEDHMNNTDAQGKPLLNQHGQPVPARKPQDNRSQLERARVLFDYTAENEDELTITEGEFIYILDKNLEDGGWWKGEVHGKVGVFPDNFVELLPPEDATRGYPQKAKKPTPQVPQPPLKGKMGQQPGMVGQQQGKMGRDEKPARPAVPAPPATGTKKPAPPPTVDGGFDQMETGNKLMHPTADRAKAPPQRRPPSIRGQDKMGMSPSGPQVDGHLDGPAQHQLAELQKQIEQLRLNSVTRQAYDQLQQSNDQLRQEVREMRDMMEKSKNTMHKRMMDLMAEVDEEKKTRLNMQVEIDRIKKLVTSA